MTALTSDQRIRPLAGQCVACFPDNQKEALIIATGSP